MLKKINNNRGQSLIEFVLVLPVILIMLIGMIEFGIMFNSYLTLNNAARDGARMASVGNGDGEINSRIDEITGNLDPAYMTITINPGEGSRDRGDSVQVTIDYEHHVFTPFIGSFIGNTISLQGRTVMRIE